MSEKTTANDICKNGTHSVLEANQTQSLIRKEDEEDAFDDSSSSYSYCTALSSLTEYSDALEDEEECMICAEPQCVNASFGPTFFVDPSGGTSPTTSSSIWPEIAVPPKELKTEEVEDTRAEIPKPSSPPGSNIINLYSVFTNSADVEQNNAISLKEPKSEDDDVSSSARDPPSLQSKPFPSSPNVLKLNSVITYSADSEQYTANKPRVKREESLLKPWDYIRSSNTSAQTDANSSSSARDPVSPQSKPFLLSPNLVNLTSGNTNSADSEQHNAVSLKELKTEKEEDEDTGTSQDVQGEESLYVWDEISLSERDPISSQSKPLPSSPNIANLNSENTNSADSEKYNAFPLKELKPEEEEDTGTSQDILGEESLYLWDEISLSERDPLALQSKPFPLSPYINVINVNSAEVEPYNAVQLKELKPEEEEDEDTGSSQNILGDKSLYLQDDVSSSATDPLLIQSKPFLSSSNIIHLNSVNTNSVDSEQNNAVPLKELKAEEEEDEDIGTTHEILGEESINISDEVSSSARDSLSPQSKPFPSSPNFLKLTSRNTNSTDVEQNNAVPLKELKPEEEEDIGTPHYVLGEESLYVCDKVSSSGRDPLLLHSKPFPSSPKSVNLNSVNKNAADSEKYNAFPLKELKSEDDEDTGTSQDILGEESLYLWDEISLSERDPLATQSKPFPSSPSVNTIAADVEQYNAAPLKELKQEENEDAGTSQDILGKESLYIRDESARVSSSARDPLLLQSKPFPLSPYINVINVNSAEVEPYNAVQLKELKPGEEEDEDTRSSQDILGYKFLYLQDDVSSSATDPLLIQSKPFLSSSNIIHLNSVNTNSVDSEQNNAVPLKELKAEEEKNENMCNDEHYNVVPLKELKPRKEEDEDTGTLQEILCDESLYIQDDVSSSARETLLLQSKPFPKSSNVLNLNSMITDSADSDLLRRNRKESLLKPWDYFRRDYVNTQQTSFTPTLTEECPCKPDRTSSPGKYPSSNPKIKLQNLNTINILDTGTKAAQPVDSSNTNPLLNSCDYFNSSKTTAQTNTTPVEQSDCLEPTFISNTILTTSEVNQYNQEVGQQHSGTKPKVDPLTHQQSLRDGPNKLGPEDKPDRGGSIVGHINWEGEEQGRRGEKEQAELSLKARNRKPPACCISTLTANKQKLGIPPRCYSERILATGHQQPPRSPPVSWRWQKQSRQGVLLSSSLPPKPCSIARHHCSAADNTKDILNMATKLAKTNTEVRSLDTDPDANYLDVFSSSRWSSNQLSPDEGFHDLSTDVPSFKVPMISAKSHYTSACSEASSVECIDVALESHAEVNRGAKTVPKRQIQLKRRDAADSQTNENNSCDGFLVPATSSRPRDILQRQHSTPAAFHQDTHGSEVELKLAQTERKQRLQKSLSLDETSGKTKKASCLIKTILSKKMQEEENLRTVEVPDRAFAPIKAYNTSSISERLTASTKEVCTETQSTAKVNLTTGALLSYGTSPNLQISRSVKEHISVSSKIQPKLMTKHSFNPLFSGRSDFLSDISAEITTFPEKNEKEKLSSSKEAAWITRASQSSGEKLFCDSAKGKVWNSSAGMGKQATVKTTPEECFAVQRGHKQHNVKTDLITTSTVKQVKQGESKESTQCLSLTMAGNSLAYDQDVRTREPSNVLSMSGQCSPVKEPEHDREDPRPPGQSVQSVNMGMQSQGKFKAIAPVHVVRDMRSLVKNTYSLSFRGPGEAAHGTENSTPVFSSASPHQISSKGEDRGKGFKQDEKPQVRKVTPPLALDRIRDLASLPKTPKGGGCATKPTALLESHDKSPSAAFTKVSPIIAAKANSCALAASKSPVHPEQAQYIQKSISKGNITNITNLKQTKMVGMRAAPPSNSTEASTEILPKNGQSEDSSKLEYKKHQDSVEQRQHLTRQYCPPILRSSEEVESCKPSDIHQIFSTVKDDRQTPGPPPRPQSTAGPPPACILTVAPTPVLPQVLPPYFYKANPLGYQTVPPHMGTVSYVQGPVLLQTPPLNQPAAAITATANCPIPLMRSLSEEVRLLSQPFPTDGSSVQQRSMQQTENGEIRLKMATPDTQQCTAFVATLGAEVIQGSTGMLYQEMGGGLAQSPRQVLLDPETGRCFYVDMPQLPQRKMLFDPQTCQYVEVLLPQQTVPSTVMPSPCAVPVPSLHIPAIYTPHCLPYVQAHPQLLPPPGP